MLILIAGPVREAVIHIQLILWGCHEADYVITNQVALLGSASHYMAAARWPLPLGPRQAGSKIPNLPSWSAAGPAAESPQES